GIAAQRVGEAGARALDLARARLATELGHDLGDLGGPGGADRMALGFEAAGDVDRNLATEARPALLGRWAAHARLEEAPSLGGHDLGDREAVVQLYDVHILRAAARLTVGGGRRPLGGGDARQVALVVHEHRVAGRRAPQDPDGPTMLARDLLRGQHER